MADVAKRFVPLLDRILVQKLKAEVLESKLKAQGKANAVADDKQELATAKKEVSQLNDDARKEKTKVSEADSKLQAKETQVKDEQARSKKAVDPAELEALKAKKQALKAKEQEKKREVTKEDKKAAEANRASAALKEQLKAADSRLDRVKSVAKSVQGQIKELESTKEEQKKKHQVLSKVQQSWESTLASNKEAAVREKAQKEKTAEHLKKLEHENLAAQQKDTEVQMAKERKAIKLEQAVKAVSYQLKLAQQENGAVKRKEAKAREKLSTLKAQGLHASKSIESLRERKRLLIQSKLDDLEKKSAPFHNEGQQAMGKMAEANKLRATDLQKTEAIVRAAEAKSQAPTR